MIPLPPLRRLLLALVMLGLAAGFLLGRLAWDIPAALVALVVLIDLIRALRRGVGGCGEDRPFVVPEKKGPLPTHSSRSGLPRDRVARGPRRALDHADLFEIQA